MLTLVVLLGGAAPARAQVPAETFGQYCAACHTIGGGSLVGPDLKDVTNRKDRPWLVQFILDPQGVVDAGDPYARQMVDAAGGLVMPATPGMTPQMAEALLDYIEAQGQGAEPAVETATVGDQPFTDADVQRGRDYFAGTTPFAAGGSACLACHNTGGAGGFGGGKLGPDLTQVFDRLQGRRGLAAWLGSPATPTMRTLFSTKRLTEEEIQSLVAYFERATAEEAEAAAAGPWLFLLSGLAGAALALAVFSWAWRNRLRAVRRALVDSVRPGGTS